MPALRLPLKITGAIKDGQTKWLRLVHHAENLVKDDVNLQEKAAKGFRIKERSVPPEVIGRIYAQYCDLINRIYDAYLNNVQLQRATYMLEIVGLMVKRLYELRNELVHLLVNDYVYVDAALIQLFKTPDDIQIVTPYHLAVESRPGSIEELLQVMWSDAVKRKNAPLKVKPTKTSSSLSLFKGEDGDLFQQQKEEEIAEEEEEEIVSVESVHIETSEDFVQIVLIQKHERFRKSFMVAFRNQCRKRKMYFADKTNQAPKKLRAKASGLIKQVYRVMMQIRRQRVRDFKRDVLLGIAVDPEHRSFTFHDENVKIYEKRRLKRLELHESYLHDMENSNVRLIFMRKDQVIEDITEEIREWFREWLYGYGFFPEYPFELAGGTTLVIRGDYPTIEEKVEADEILLAQTKGKTKEQLKQAKEKEKREEEMKAEIEKEKLANDALALFKMRCNPYADPGYNPKQSNVMENIVQVFQKYRAAWSIYDRLEPENDIDTVYGYIQTVIAEDLMAELHQDCRKYVDELMRLEMKLLIKVHQKMFKQIGKKYPKLPKRQPPKMVAIPKPFVIDKDLLKSIEQLFDLNIISKPTTKLKDVIGDISYGAYDLNIADPDARFPPPAYGDVKRRLQLSCVLGSGIEPGAARNKAVMLLGPERNGKSFLVDAVAGEMNAIKIDISPEKFSSVIKRPGEVLMTVFNAARAFQPTVIFLKNIERVFYKKCPPQEKNLKASSLKKALGKLMKKITDDTKIIFIGTCSNPFVAKTRPLVSLFSEIILIPTLDYGSIQQFFYKKLQSQISMPKDYPIQPLAQYFQGYGFGVLNEMYNRVMTSERIVRLNCEPLRHLEFIDQLIEDEIDPMSSEDFEKYTAFFLRYSSIYKERIEFDVINQKRAYAYEKTS